MSETKEEIMDDSTNIIQQQQEENVTDDGGVKKKILVEGKGWKTPKKGCDVEVHYVGTLENGTQFDSSRDRDQPFSFKLGMGQVIKGWDQGVATMKKGEKAVFTIKSEYGYGKAGSPPKIPADATLVFEVELLGWNEFTDITKDGGVLKEMIESNEDSWESPREDSTVTIDYTLRLAKTNDNEDEDEDSDDNDNNSPIIKQEQNFQFIIGTGGEQQQEEEGGHHFVPLGLDKGVKDMKKGERAIFTIRPDYGFGETGNAKLNIPGGATLKYEVKLLDFTKEKESWEMSTQEKLEACESAKGAGNELYKQGKYVRASRKYAKAAGFVDSDYSFEESEKTAAKALKTACYANAAACHLKLSQWKEAIESCKKVLDIEPTNVKAIFRQGQAHVELDLWDEAQSDFDRVLDLDPNNKEAVREKAKLKRKIVAQEKKDRKRFKGIFEKLAQEDKEKEENNNNNNNMDVEKEN